MFLISKVFRSVFTFAVLSLVLVGGQVFGQENTGVQGTVFDETGGVLPGVSVEYEDQSGQVSSTTTDAEGVYRF